MQEPCLLCKLLSRVKNHDFFSLDRSQGPCCKAKCDGAHDDIGSRDKNLHVSNCSPMRRKHTEFKVIGYKDNKKQYALLSKPWQFNKKLPEGVGEYTCMEKCMVYYNDGSKGWQYLFRAGKVQGIVTQAKCMLKRF